MSFLFKGSLGLNLAVLPTIILTAGNINIGLLLNLQGYI